MQRRGGLQRRRRFCGLEGGAASLQEADKAGADEALNLGVGVVGQRKQPRLRSWVQGYVQGQRCWCCGVVARRTSGG